MQTKQIGDCILRRRIIPIVIAFSAIVISIISANIFFFWSIDQVIRRDITNEASRWAGSIGEEIPDLDIATQSGTFSQKQQSAIDFLLRQSEIVRLEILDISTGQTVFSRQLENDIEIASKALNNSQLREVNQGGVPFYKLDTSDIQGKGGTTIAAVATTVPAPDGKPAAIARFFVNLDETAGPLAIYSRIVATIMSVGFTAVLGLLAVAMLRNRDSAELSLGRLKYLARHDPLTDLYNRTGFERRWEEDQDNAHKAGQGNALLFIDIDHFKRINDKYSHAAGDAFIRHIGKIIQSSIKSGDIAARLSGDEFAASVYCKTKEEAESIAAEICRQANKPAVSHGMHINGSVSIGIHFCHKHPTVLGERMKMADFALYQAKADGRGTYRNFSEDLANKSRRRHKIEGALKRALKHDYFYLVYQPKIDARTGTCSGFEALLRMKLPDDEIVMPGEFVPMMECLGIAEEVGTWVLKTAVQTALQWPRETTLAVNLSVRQVSSDNLIQTVTETLQQSGFEAHRLELEVTESLLIETPVAAEEKLAKLRDLGITVSIDDFGTGYSSLGYLWRFGFDKIKIDRSFVLGLDANRAKSLEILETIVMLGRRLDMEIIVEGVETQAQLDLLNALNVDSYQGYYFARPLPADELHAYLAKFQPVPATIGATA